MEISILWISIFGATCFLIGRLLSRPIGWVNVYQRQDGKLMISMVPKKSRSDAIQAGLIDRAQSKYIGTIKIYR